MKHLMNAVILCLLSAGIAIASPPSYKDLAKIPVVRFGEPVPSSDYILLFPAGNPVTISVSIEGSLFSKTANAELVVAPSRDIMVFKEWASLDGFNWMPSGELIKSDVFVKVPGYNHPAPGILKVRMDLAGTK